MNKTYARRRIKAEAQALMAGNWLKAFFIAVVSMLLPVFIIRFLPIRIPEVNELVNAGDDAVKLLKQFLPGSFTAKTAVSIAVTILLYLFIMSPFTVGTSRFFLEVARGRKPKFSIVFSPYMSLKTVFSSVWLTLLVFLISVFWSVIFMLVPTALIFLAVVSGSRFIALIAALLAPVSTIIAFLWNSRYTFASYIFAEGERGAFEALRECIELMHGRTKECMTLRASYFFWDILSSYMFPLTYVYFALSGTVYAKFLFYLRDTVQVMGEDTQPEI